MTETPLDVEAVTRLLEVSPNTEGSPMTPHEQGCLLELREAVQERLGGSPTLSAFYSEALHGKVEASTRARLVDELSSEIETDTAFAARLVRLQADLRHVATGASADGSAAKSGSPPNPVDLDELLERAEGDPHPQCLDASQELIDTIGDWAKLQPDPYAWILARAWKAHGYNVDSSQEAVMAFDTAARMFEQQATDSDPAVLLELAQSLESIGIVHMDMGGYIDARRPLQEAQHVGETLARLKPDVALTLQARVADSLAEASHLLDDDHSAIKYGGEAENRYRIIVESNPDYLPNLAGTLERLSRSWLQLRNADNGETYAREALQIFTHLAQENEAKYLGECADQVFNLAAIQGIKGNEPMATVGYEKAVSMYTRADQLNPNFRSALLMAARALCEQYRQTGKWRKARKFCKGWGL